MHMPGNPVVLEASAGAEAGPVARAASEQRQTSPWHAMSAGSQSLTYLHSVLPLPQHVLAMLDFVWTTDGFRPPAVPIPLQRLPRAYS